MFALISRDTRPGSGDRHQSAWEGGYVGEQPLGVKEGGMLTCADGRRIGSGALSSSPALSALTLHRR
jgi:hypothetical protein